MLFIVSPLVLLLRDTRLIYLQYNSVTIFRPKFAMPFTALLDVRCSLALKHRINVDFVLGLIIFGIAVAEGSPFCFAKYRLCANSLTLKGIIIMRTWAIWGRQKSIGIFLISLFTASLITACVCLALFEKSTHCECPYIPAQSDSAFILIRLILVVPISTLGPLSTGKGCLADRANIDVVGTYASFTVFDTGSCFDVVEMCLEY